MNRTSSPWGSLALALLLAAAASPAARATPVSAMFTVSATLAPGGNGGGTCRSTPVTGLVECGGGGGQMPGAGTGGLQPWLNYRTFGGFFWLIDAAGPGSFSSLLGAWSTTRVIQLGGREYLEMTVSW